jgi:hypothetical protein
MKITIQVFLFFISLTAYARIGETQSQCDERYGFRDPLCLDKSDKDGCALYIFSKDGVKVSCWFIDDVCQQIMYINDSSVELWAPSKIKNILSIYDSNWIQIPYDNGEKLLKTYFYKTQDGNLEAKVDYSTIIISSKFFRDKNKGL